MSDQPALFPGMEPPKQAALKRPVEKLVIVLRDVAKEDAVLIKTAIQNEHWVPRQLIRFDGLGQQRVKIESWKAEELKL